MSKNYTPLKQYLYQVSSNQGNNMYTLSLSGLSILFCILLAILNFLPNPKLISPLSSPLQKTLRASQPDSQVSISVYASTDTAMPTDPMGGYDQGIYGYDVRTAVHDFLAVMPAKKLILGTPWYGYDYLVYQPQVNSPTRPWWSWRGKPKTLTYADIVDAINPIMDGVSGFISGWDPTGQVSWKAYHVADTDTWRMVFFDDVKSLEIKYDYAKSTNLGGVGIWALGNEDGKKELWNLLLEKFGVKLAANNLAKKVIHESI